VIFVGYIVLRVKLQPALAPKTAFEEFHGWRRLQPFLQYVLPLVSIFVVVVGAMIAGWATPTECAALGAFAPCARVVIP
jgi:TRAP-type mannitol/chloroaromatic compound transport system permease large subunit